MFSPFENSFKFLKEFSINEIEVIFFTVYLVISRPPTSTTKFKWSARTSKIHKIEKRNEKTDLISRHSCQWSFDFHMSKHLLLINMSCYKYFKVSTNFQLTISVSNMKRKVKKLQAEMVDSTFYTQNQWRLCRHVVVW